MPEVETKGQRSRVMNERRPPVIEDGDDPITSAPDPDVVLVGEPRPRPHFEARVPAPQDPHRLRGQAIDLVRRPRVSPGDDEVAVEVLIDRVEVEVVVRRLQWAV